jgi:ribosome biogenesis GTPase
MELIGRLMGSSGGLYEIKLNSGEQVFCRAKGALRHDDLTPLVGDLVRIDRDDKGNTVLAEILPRKNALIRPPLSNLTLLFVVIPTAKPAPDLFTVDKLTAIAIYHGIEVLPIVSKAELDPEKAEEIAGIYRTAGFTVFVTDSPAGLGVEPLREALSEKLRPEDGNTPICAFAGASGVGKSTLLNALFPSLSLSTGEVSRKISRGKEKFHRLAAFKQKIRKFCSAVYFFRFFHLAFSAQMQYLEFAFFNRSERLRKIIVENHCSLTASEDQYGL